MRANSGTCSLDTPPSCPSQAITCSQGVTSGSDDERRLHQAVNQLGALVCDAVAEASHRKQNAFIAAVLKHASDTATVCEMHNSLRKRNPHMFRRLRNIASAAQERPVPRKAAAPPFNLQTWVSHHQCTVTSHYSHGVCSLERDGGASWVLKHKFSTAEALLRELRCLCLTTGMPGIVQAAVTPAGDLGAVYTMGQPSALLLQAVDGIALSEAVQDGRMAELCDQCAASLAETLARLHASHLVHGDVHPGNVLVVSNWTEVMLCDLGATSFATEGLQKYGRRGWKAPEIVHATSENCWNLPFVTGEKARALDVWALSVTLLCMATGQASLGSDGDAQDKVMRTLALDTARDLDLWGRRHRFARGVCADRSALVWHAAAVGLQISPRARLKAERIAQLLHAEK
jgi:hypothetical protein